MTPQQALVDDTTVVSTNTYWTLVYAFIAIDLGPIPRDVDFEALAFDIAVSGGIVFG